MAKLRVKVHVVRYPDRSDLVLRYVDPITKRQKQRTAGTADKKEAERAAARWEDELLTGKFKAADQLTWEEFRDRFEDEYLAFKSDGYFYTFQAAFSRFEKDTGIQELSSVPAVLDEYELKLRRSKLSPNTVRSYLKHLKVALSWAAEKGLLETVKLKLPDAPDDQMKGRPLTDPEFALLLQHVTAETVGADSVASWLHFLKGVWLSGLRRSEALRLSWDADADFHVDLSGLYPRFRIRAAGQKSRRGQYCSMAPDFAEWLLSVTPQADRTGRVFGPLGKAGVPMTDSEVGRRVGEIAVAAEIYSDPRKKKPVGLHDFRRSFGTRWAKTLMPVDLKALMRHADISTTMKFYVTSDADDLSARMWAKMQAAAETAAEMPKAASE